MPTKLKNSALFGLGHGADLVPVLEVDQPDALGGAAREPEVEKKSTRDVIIYRSLREA